MKKIVLLIAAVTLLLSAKAQVQKPITTSFKVYGNCGQCKERIETALDTRGVKQAIWNVKTKQLEVTYQPDKISLQQIQQRILASGHDLDTLQAPDATYVELPECCLYRNPLKKTHE